MKYIAAMGSLALLVSGCATQMVEYNAKSACAEQGKKAFIYNSKQNGIPLVIESASAMSVCVGPDDVIHLPSTFGADAISGSNLHGAGIVSVDAGSIAEKAGLKANDIIYEFAGHPISLVSDLRVAINSMSSGDQALMKLRRNGGNDITATAHF